MAPRLMSSGLKDSIATTQAQETPQQGTGEKACGPGALLMLCVLSPVYAAGKAAARASQAFTPQHLCPPLPLQDPAPPAMIPMGPLYNGYSGDFGQE